MSKLLVAQSFCRRSVVESGEHFSRLIYVGSGASDNISVYSNLYEVICKMISLAINRRRMKHFFKVFVATLNTYTLK